MIITQPVETADVTTPEVGLATLGPGLVCTGSPDMTALLGVTTYP